LPKNRDRSSDEFYRGKIRELNKEIKQLLKRIKELEKFQYIPSQDEEQIRDTEDTYRELPRIERCQSCGKGELETIDIVGRIFKVCSLCGERRKVAGP